MPATDLHHLAIKTGDVDASVEFYNEVIGSHSVKRPNFNIVILEYYLNTNLKAGNTKFWWAVTTLIQSAGLPYTVSVYF